jgi:hypothetical protein
LPCPLVVVHQRRATLHADGFRHPVHEQRRAERKPDQDAMGEVTEDRQQQRRKQDERITGWRAAVIRAIRHRASP